MTKEQKNELYKSIVNVMPKVQNIGFIISLVCIGSIIVWTIVRSTFAIMYSNNTGARYEVVARNNDPHIVSAELKSLILETEKNNWTTGYTSAYWNSEDENLGLWYINLISAKNRIDAIMSSEVSKTEVSTTMISVQQSFKLNSGGYKDGPDGLSVYPHNKAYANIIWFFFILGLLSITVWLCSQMVQEHYEGKIRWG